MARDKKNALPFVIYSLCTDFIIISLAMKKNVP